MNHEIIPKKNCPINAEIEIPGSKSITNRVLLMAGLAHGESRLSGVLISDDTKVMAEALENLGVSIQIDPIRHTAIIQGCAGKFPKNNIQIYTHESGTATRFLIPAVAACGLGQYYFYGSDRMMERPLEKQIEALRSLGISFDFEKAKNKMPFYLKTAGLNNLGNKSEVEIEIDIHESSQFLSGLMMAAPYAKLNTKSGLVLKSLQEIGNKPYVQMTAKLMKDFGVNVDLEKIKGHEVMIGPGSYQAKNFAIEPDMSTASYFFAMPAILGGEILIKNCSRAGCLQGDIRFLEVLEKMGCLIQEEVQEENRGIRVSKESGKILKGIEINMAGFSDTFMTIAAVACFAEGPTVLKSLAHTRLQESDRVKAISDGLEKLGVKTESTQDSLTIIPDSSKLKGAKVNSFNDHRIAMSLSLLGLKIPGVMIENSQAVAKTCPNFYELLEAI